uniref:Si:ch211-256a21.4 n=1 Tax=Amphilophus citrinellus TaxID=61819 RepID=A0A3Q0QSV2_AMPCI
MKFLELDDQISRFRFSQSCLGLTGCLCVCYAVWTPYWLKDRGLWTGGNTTERDQTNRKDDIDINERVFGILSSLMAVSTAALCLVFALCWTSQTVRSYSNTRSLLMAQKALYPTTLLLFTMAPTFFFLLSWSFFTYEHHEEIRQDFSSLGSSYWLGALGWILLLVVESIVFIVEQAVVPNILPDLEKAMDSWRISSQLKAAECSFSGSSHPFSPKSNMTPKIYMSLH